MKLPEKAAHAALSSLEKRAKQFDTSFNFINEQLLLDAFVEVYYQCAADLIEIVDEKCQVKDVGCDFIKEIEREREDEGPNSHGEGF